MFYSDNVQDTRQMFFSSWQKYLQKQPLLPLEQQIVDVILAHPEYHMLLETSSLGNQSYFPELGQTNPYLHMGLHIAIREQIGTDRPNGINSVYRQLLQKYGDQLVVEHLMMECLAESLWQAQRNQSFPSEKDYLDALKRLLGAR
ncbi:DUF1841 family protein [Legionella tunisiensis]|uniref:DUF1841 family protein n=1 Tax=Legionella tunisiensis TaxID=1034944 RepID=UPI0003200350|nr:DUF1841 family protein [Legionella tunisiensis]